MKCITCEKEAQAICKFCGRAVCKDHIKHQRYPSGYTNRFGAFSRQENAVAIPDAVWCGHCRLEFSRTA